MQRVGTKRQDFYDHFPLTLVPTSAPAVLKGNVNYEYEAAKELLSVDNDYVQIWRFGICFSACK